MTDAGGGGHGVWQGRQRLSGRRVCVQDGRGAAQVLPPTRPVESALTEWRAGCTGMTHTMLKRWLASRVLISGPKNDPPGLLMTKCTIAVIISSCPCGNL